MVIRRLFSLGTLALAGLAVGALGLDHGSADAAKKTTKKGIITKPAFDPTAERVELMDAIDAGQVTAKLIPKNSKGGNVLIENKTDKPLTIELPDAVVGVSVHSQFGAGGGGGFGGQGGGMGGMGGQGMGGGQQAMGGGMGGMGGGMGGMGGGGMGGMGGGGGFFSIAPETIVSIPMTSVCLEHGKAEPHPRSDYRLIRVEEFSDNPVLPELLALVGSGKLNTDAAQAAAWHLTDSMSWAELARKTEFRLGGVGHVPYFTQQQLMGAQQIFALAQGRASEKAESKGETEPKAPLPRTRVPQAAR